MTKNLPQSTDAASGELPPVVRPARLRQLGFDGSTVDRLDFLAEEVPVALVYNGISHAVMMTSPADLEDFARGFSLSEGIIEDATEIRDVEAVPHEKGIELNIDLASQRFHLEAWDTSIIRKLQTVDSIYGKMADRATTQRMEYLEWIIIVLITISIAISFLPMASH